MKLSDRIPRDYAANLRWRLFLIRKARNNRPLQAALREACRLDVIFWINTFIWQINPDKGSSVGPFICWLFQERAIEKIQWCIKNSRSVVVEKSRKMGATWLVLIVKDYNCRFRSYYSSLMMSKDQDAVNGTTHESLFGKLNFIQEFMPDFIGKNIGTKKGLKYQESNSIMIGFASTGNAGVSERGNDFLVDEMGKIVEAFEVLARTQATSLCRIFVGTHTGTGTAFHTICLDDYFQKIVMHWTQSPEMNKGMYRWDAKAGKMEWFRYDEESDCLEVVDGPHQYDFPDNYSFDKTGHPVGGPHPGVRSPGYDRAFHEMAGSVTEMAKDYDINPSGSVSQFYNPLLINELSPLCRPPLGEYELEYNKETGTPTRFVHTRNGRIKLWCPLDQSGRLPIGFYSLGTDISTGQGVTPSCLSGWYAPTGTKLLEYIDPYIGPKEFGTFAVALARMLIDEQGLGAKIGWEHHGPGTVFGDQVWKFFKYLRIWFNVRGMALAEEMSDKPGWYPTKTARYQAHADYRQALYERRAHNLSRKALEETLNFKNIDGSVEHSQYRNKSDPAHGRENHGDIVVADVIGWMIVKDVASVMDPKKSLVAPPGSLQFLFDEEARSIARKGELYPDWERRLRRI